MDLKFDPENPKFEYITTGDRAVEALKELDKHSILGVDVESSGLDPYTSKLLLLQVGTDTVSYIFDTRELNMREFPLLKTMLEDKSKMKILQNAKFDYGFLKVKCGIETDNIFDTMLAEQVLRAGLAAKSGLGALATRYIGEGTIDKALQKSFINQMGRISVDQLKYAALDTLILFPIFEKQAQLLKKEGLIKIAKLEFAVTRVVAEMELKGIYIDQKKWRDILKNLSKRRESLAQEFQDAIRPYYEYSQQDLFGNMADAINMNSQVQLLDLFNNRLNLNIPSTGDGILATVNHPLVKLLRDYRGYEKLLSAFGESLLEKINPVTHRIHPDFRQLGAATGRFACSNPNLQQIPRNSEEAPFRECFNPEEGYDFVVADYSSFEMRILADLSGDETFINALREGLDMHSYTAALMFGLPYDEIKENHKDKRQAAKALGFGLMYGMGPMGLAGRLGISKEEGQEYMDRYFGAYPGVRKFLDGMASDALKNGWSSTPAGRKRWYNRPDKSDPDYRKKIGNIGRQAKNHPIQGTNADAVKYALVFLHDRLKKEKVDGAITHTVHDEVVCEVREDQAEDWSVIQQEEMVRAGELFIKNVPVISDPFIGKVWEH
ncbi:MAG: DNA polymerase [Patescibacteria group bacterium]